MADNKSSSSGIGCFTVLFFIFLVLKLTGTGIVATWSWWWIFAPLWAPLAIFLVFLLFCAIMALLIN